MRYGFLYPLLLLCSCVHDERGTCPVPPSAYLLQVAVADKNYENPVVRLNEQQPFKTWVQTLTVSTDNQTFARDEPFSGTETTHPLSTFDFTAGAHFFALAANTATNRDLELHPGGSESSDSYLGAVTASLPLGSDQTISLYRTKGLLMVETDALPADRTDLKITVSDLYARATQAEDGTIRYRGNTQVTKQFTTADPTQIRLAPSADGQSYVQISFTSGGKIQELPLFLITIARNRITRIRPVPGDDRQWTITVQVDGTWREIDNLTLQK